MNNKVTCGYFSVGLLYFTCKTTLRVMTWKFCSVFDCDNSEKKKIACVQSCKKSHSKEKCTHERKYPELQNVSFFSIPKERELQRKWFPFLRRTDIKSISQTTSNHMICSVHFQGVIGYCKVDPFPTIYNDLAMALRFNTNTTKRKALTPRSPLFVFFFCLFV